MGVVDGFVVLGKWTSGVLSWDVLKMRMKRAMLSFNMYNGKVSGSGDGDGIGVWMDDDQLPVACFSR